MYDTFIKCIAIIYIIRLILKHNLFIHHLKIKIKILGLDIEVKSKEKSALSFKATGSVLRCKTKININFHIKNHHEFFMVILAYLIDLYIYLY